jgi:chromatin segregation and condensation protein Rec8/ScpA/Scc1 (kleisin family)
MEKQGNKTKWLHVRLSAEEQELVQKRFKTTTCRKLSEYVRNKLLDKHLTNYYRNKSLDDFMAELILLRTELNHIGNNFNQAVRKLNSMRLQDHPDSWAKMYDKDRIKVIGQVLEIQDHMQKFAEQWLQNSRQDRP